jgi:hypothetical protein
MELVRGSGPDEDRFVPVRNAQDLGEAIRPGGQELVSGTPESLRLGS